MITYYKNQEELADALKKIIDSYWDLDIKESVLVESLFRIIENNREMIYKNGDYTTVLKQRLGLRRLNLIEKVFSNRK